ncbi:diguanylate cyclase domain-containing protein [Halochromatium roseum]|uniref:diguanylate cyclase domain-containing protein n=1 Tax=Halochromatium roseum TaxID=391920 RepID=UPI00237B8DF1|nr:diguanylate cyclase [Halochromatium roseum]MBK5941049.1 hypothetical protein [Halochromatium roseum]
MQQVIRRTDHLARWGGEEFLLLALEIDLEQAALHRAKRAGRNWVVIDRSGAGTP